MSVMNRLRAGEFADKEAFTKAADDEVDRWHELTSANGLANYLGMTTEEYRAFVTRPSSLFDTLIEATNRRIEETLLGPSELKAGEGRTVVVTVTMMAAPKVEQIEMKVAIERPGGAEGVSADSEHDST